MGLSDFRVQAMGDQPGLKTDAQLNSLRDRPNR
jgi:hypothetical protein